jgi:hypothetical protein
MKTTTEAAAKRNQQVDTLRLVASVAWLVFAAFAFQAPIAGLFVPPTADGGQRQDASILSRPVAAGFVLQMASDPPGARLFVDGTDRGQLPLVTNIECENGAQVALEVVKNRYAPWKSLQTCVDGEHVEIKAWLVR